MCIYINIYCVVKEFLLIHEGETSRGRIRGRPAAAAAAAESPASGKLLLGGGSGGGGESLAESCTPADNMLGLGMFKGSENYSFEMDESCTCQV